MPITKIRPEDENESDPDSVALKDPTVSTYPEAKNVSFCSNPVKLPFTYIFPDDANESFISVESNDPLIMTLPEPESVSFASNPCKSPIVVLVVVP